MTPSPSNLSPRLNAARLLLIGLFTCVTACMQAPANDAPKAATEQLGASNTHDEHSGLPLPKRLAFMSGHVEAGLALYRAGEPGMAAPHLAHPVSETHASEREGLDALGFDAEVFLEVSNALKNRVAASDIEAQLTTAETNLADLADRAGGDPKEIIHFLLDTVVEEYGIGVRDGRVTDPGEYQDAYGFTVIAMKQSNKLGMPKARLVRNELEVLLAAWPAAPVPPANPTPAGKVRQLVDNVRATLNAHHR